MVNLTNKSIYIFSLAALKGICAALKLVLATSSPIMSQVMPNVYPELQNMFLLSAWTLCLCFCFHQIKVWDNPWLSSWLSFLNACSSSQQLIHTSSSRKSKICPCLLNKRKVHLINKVVKIHYVYCMFTNSLLHSGSTWAVSHHVTFKNSQSYNNMYLTY